MRRSLATALDVALDPAFAPGGDAAATAQLMYAVSDNLWLTGEIFFGLWLVPMGWLVLLSGWMPRPLGWILIVGGIGYVLGPFLAYLTDVRVAADLVVVPATIGEFWMIGYLLVRGVTWPRRRARRPTPGSRHRISAGWPCEGLPTAWQHGPPPSACSGRPTSAKPP